MPEEKRALTRHDLGEQTVRERPGANRGRHARPEEPGTTRRGPYVVLALILVTLVTLATVVTVVRLRTVPEEQLRADQEAVQSEGNTAFDLVTGDCFTFPRGEAVTQVPEVACTSAHDAEVTATYELPEGAWPGDEAVRTQAEQRCEAALRDYVGIDPLDSTYGPEFFTPDRTAFEAGADRVVICLAVAPDTVTSSAKGARR